MSILKHVLVLVFFFTFIVLSHSLSAQVFPVQGHVVLNPPYSPYLADLTALGSQRFWLTLRLQDPTINTYNCKLRLITIEVLDYDRGTGVSSKIGTTAHLALL